MTPGTKLGPYEIVAPIDAGGMGEVYRAHDTKLNRDVAIKVLPEMFAADPERLARFTREAQLLAALNHPHIAAIYGFEESQGIRALVLELVEGSTLADRIAQGPMPLVEALRIAQQIAEALGAAHEKGIIHRDLKPANVKLTATGQVKVLDFGLAKLLETDAAVAGQPRPYSPSLTHSPTLTTPAMTLGGVLLGTAAYMSPEQARGESVDKRADIWAFGVVLWEMLTGERLFQGKTTSDVLAAVIRDEPVLSQVPAKVQPLLTKCLVKDAQQRLRDIGDAMGIVEITPEPRPISSRVIWTLTAVAAVLLFALTAVTVVAWRYVREDRSLVVKFDLSQLQPGALERLVPALAVSPDGRHVAFEATVKGQRTLWVRDLDTTALRRLADVEAAPELPFWAPDSRRLAFFTDGKLKSIDVSGGPASTIADAGGISPASGSWNQDDVIVFGHLNSGLFRVAAKGGSPVPLTTLDRSRNEMAHWAPWFLPDGRHFLYLIASADREKGGLYVGDLASKTLKPVAIGNTRAIYVNPGYLLFVREHTLMAQPFNASTMEITGNAAPVAEEVTAPTTVTGGPLGHFSASQNGVLAYLTGVTSGAVELTWYDQSGKKLDTSGVVGVIQLFSLSPDGRSIAFARQDETAGNFDVWTRDLVRGSDSRLTLTGNNLYPISPDDVPPFAGIRARVPGLGENTITSS
jgi:hypothetical protein